MEYKIIIYKQAKKDREKIRQNPALAKTTDKLIEILKINPFQNPPPYEKLQGEILGLYSRRINIKHRLVYSVNEENKEVLILSLWTHYDNI